jgi:diguanylate cyclase (GGDEF)-like protein
MPFEPPLHPERRDPLTGLPTRQEFDAHLLAVCGQGRGSLLLCDLDYLKLINDTLGHPAGDAALRDLAATLCGGLRPGSVSYTHLTLPTKA